MHENLKCNLGDIHFGAIFSADDIILLGAFAHKVQCIINICSAQILVLMELLWIRLKLISFIVVCMADVTVLISR
jgi:hypothetical protein